MESNGDVRPMRTVVSTLRRKLRDDAESPTYFFAEPRVGYRIPKGDNADVDDTGWKCSNRRPNQPRIQKRLDLRTSCSGV